jgi:hypothetical protein
MPTSRLFRAIGIAAALSGFVTSASAVASTAIAGA